MTFFKAEIMSAPLLEISNQLWSGLIGHLHAQGAGVRESGAFLLGQAAETGRTVTGFIPYEELQADALQEDYVTLSAASFSKLWSVCREHSLTVVADVHTHRFGPQQSRSDKANPMLALAGHVALIVPRFAQGNVQLEDLGVHLYRGSHQWTSQFGPSVRHLINVTRPWNAYDNPGNTAPTGETRT